MTENVAALAAVLSALDRVAPPDEVWPDAALDELGLSGDARARAAGRIEAILGVPVEPAELAHTTPRALAGAVAARTGRALATV